MKVGMAARTLFLDYPLLAHSDTENDLQWIYLPESVYFKGLLASYFLYYVLNLRLSCVQLLLIFHAVDALCNHLVII